MGVRVRSTKLALDGRRINESETRGKEKESIVYPEDVAIFATRSKPLTRLRSHRLAAEVVKNIMINLPPSSHAEIAPGWSCRNGGRAGTGLLVPDPEREGERSGAIVDRAS